MLGFNQDNVETDLFASYPYNYVNILMNLDFRFFHNIDMNIEPEIQQSYLKMKDYILRLFNLKSKRLFKIKKASRAKVEEEYFFRGNSYRFKHDDNLFQQLNIGNSTFINSEQIIIRVPFNWQQKHTL